MIEGVVVKTLNRFSDKRGWLLEIFREDETGPLSIHKPAMAYVSMTQPGVERGPHEHSQQTDYFCFLSSRFMVTLWDNRRTSPTFGERMDIQADEDAPTIILVPPLVVHRYKNIGDRDGLVINLPDRLYKGWGRVDAVDEVRYENDPNSPFS